MPSSPTTLSFTFLSTRKHENQIDKLIIRVGLRRIQPKICFSCRRNLSSLLVQLPFFLFLYQTQLRYPPHTNHLPPLPRQPKTYVYNYGSTLPCLLQQIHTFFSHHSQISHYVSHWMGLIRSSLFIHKIKGSDTNC